MIREIPCSAPAEIRKRDGSIRSLLVPDPLLKKIQRNILHNILDQMPVSPYATAYHKGAGIRLNARPHSGAKLLLKLDIKDFFENILFSQVYQQAFPTQF